MKASVLLGPGWEKDSVEVLWRDSGLAFCKLWGTDTEGEILNSGQVFAVDESWLAKQPIRGRPQVASPAPPQGKSRSERELIEAALAASRGRIAGRSGAAAKLGVPPSTLDHRIKALPLLGKKRTSVSY